MSGYVVLHDGQEVERRSEAWRHECEARYILSLPTKAHRRRQLDRIREVRGPEAARRLERTMLAIWKSNQGSR